MSKHETKRWRVVIEPYTGDDPRGRVRRALRPRKWHWSREWSVVGRWWVDAEGYTETIHGACRKAMGAWKLWAQDTHRMEIEYAIDATPCQGRALIEGRADMELLS